MLGEYKVIFLVFFVYRISQLIAIDDGPFDVFLRIRKCLGVLSAREPDSIFKLTLAKLVNCPFCLGVWFSALAYLLYPIDNILVDFIVGVFGLAGMQTLLENITSR